MLCFGRVFFHERLRYPASSNNVLMSTPGGKCYVPVARTFETLPDQRHFDQRNQQTEIISRLLIISGSLFCFSPLRTLGIDWIAYQAFFFICTVFPSFFMFIILSTMANSHNQWVFTRRNLFPLFLLCKSSKVYFFFSTNECNYRT